MKEICKHCKWWNTESNRSETAFRLTLGRQGLRKESVICYPCNHPKIEEFVDLGINQDDVAYFASDFGCVLFEPK